MFDNDEFWEKVRRWSTNNIVVVSELVVPNDFVEVWNYDVNRSAAQSKKTRFLGESETRSIEKLFVHNSIVDRI